MLPGGFFFGKKGGKGKALRGPAGRKMEFISRHSPDRALPGGSEGGAVVQLGDLLLPDGLGLRGRTGVQGTQQEDLHLGLGVQQSVLPGDQGIPPEAVLLRQQPALLGMEAVLLLLELLLRRQQGGEQ